MIELSLDEVLYRDQRTFRTRLTFRTSERSPQTAEESRGSVDSSLCSYCHNQYFNGNKRLCQCIETEDVKCRSSKKCDQWWKNGTKSWLKKFPHQFLLLSTCLTLLSFPCASAFPATFRTFGAPSSFLLRRLMSMEKNEGIFKRIALLKGDNESLNTSVAATLVSIESASKSAQELSRAFFDQYYPDSNPMDSRFKGIQSDWLPKVPSRTREETEEYLQNLMSDETLLSEALQKLYEDLITLHGALKQIKLENQQDPTLEDPVVAHHVEVTAGFIRTLWQDLAAIFESIGWKLNVKSEFVMPEEQKNDLTKTYRTSRNMLIIQSLLEVTNELMTFKDFKI
ncbi:uncharacterized protein LOC126734483 [Anthonomus grandis grandis]|uniref:uncharacterized protein LOC126734483 n=1 Tax=Anthonomus grandis grandis TaxID=2921223 RepID=UPI0021669636|nr:uncharacterized protein LOC126734483 [Anthonomus grandis grandis]